MSAARIDSRIPLVSLIAEHVPLQRRGNLHVGCCPFHLEKTPSFTVYPDGHYHCFGCGAHGDAITFLQRIKGLSFSEARERAGDTKRPRPKQRRSHGAASYAVRLVAESRPISGTLAERYLREARDLGELPLPTELRFHPAVWSRETGSAHPALIAPCYDGDRLARVHAVLLNPATGEKANVPSPKLTFGAGESHVPASFAARIQNTWKSLTEGPEDAITIAAATGLRADASLGANSLGKPQYAPGTNLIIFGDNGETGHAPAKAATEAHRARGINVWLVFPPEGIKDVNDLLRQGGPDAVRACIHRALHPGLTGLPAYYPAVTEPLEDALRRLDGIINTFIADAVVIAAARHDVTQRRADALRDVEDPTPADKMRLTKQIKREVAARYGFAKGKLPRQEHKLLTGAQAVGKTTIALKAIARIEESITVRKYAPTLEKAEEDLRDYRRYAAEHSMPAMVVRGRGASDPQREGEAMCPRHKVVNRAAQLGLAPRKSICPSCKLNKVCGTLRQESNITDLGNRALYIMAKDYACLPCPAPEPDIVIGDERMTLEAVQSAEVPLDDLTASLVPHFIAAPAARQTIDVLRNALSDARPLAALRATSTGRAELRALRKALDVKLEARIMGTMSDEAISAELDAIDQQGRLRVLALVAAVLREIDLPRDTLTAVTFDAQTRIVQVATLRRMRSIKHAAVLMMDGTGNEALNRVLLGKRLTHDVVRVERNAHVTGTTGRRYSRQSITGLDRDGAEIKNRSAGAGRLREEIGTIAAHSTEPLVVGTKRAVASLIDGGHLPADATTMSYGALRGKNDAEHRPTVIAVGQESVSIDTAEMIARAFMATDPTPFVSMARPDLPADWPYKQWPYRASRMRRMRDGTLQAVEVDVHPDPRVQRILEQVREAEVIQGIDRVRPVFNRRDIVALNNLVLDLTYDEICPHRELVQGGDRIALALERAGVLPETASELARAFPDLFGSEGTAARDLRAWRQKRSQIPNRESICDLTPFLYRRPGQRGRSARVLVATRHAGAKAAAEAVLGPLATFEATT